MQWFKPFSTLEHSAMGVAEAHSFTRPWTRHEVERSGQTVGLLRHLRYWVPRFKVPRYSERPIVLCSIVLRCDGRGAVESQSALRQGLRQISRRRLQRSCTRAVRRSWSGTPRSTSGGCNRSSGDGPGWSNVENGTLVGAVRVTGPFKEIRGKVVAPGVYTLRYGQQPQNGDHLGISTFRDFLLLSPASCRHGSEGARLRRCRGAVEAGDRHVTSGVVQHRPARRRAGRRAVGLQERLWP